MFILTLLVSLLGWTRKRKVRNNFIGKKNWYKHQATVLNTGVIETKGTLVHKQSGHEEKAKRTGNSKPVYVHHNSGKPGCYWNRRQGTHTVYSRSDKEGFLEEVPELSLEEGTTVRQEEKLGTEAVNPGRQCVQSQRQRGRALGWYAVRNKAGDVGGEWITKGLRPQWR